MNEDNQRRLRQLVLLVDKENHHLQGVQKRLFGSSTQFEPAQLHSLLQTDTGIDRLESFGAKFSRMQDSVVDKLIPLFLTLSGERVSTAINNLEHLERLSLISSADTWLAMRSLRNLLVHEYIDEENQLNIIMKKAWLLSVQMQQDYATLRSAIVEQFPLADQNSAL